MTSPLSKAADAMIADALATDPNVSHITADVIRSMANEMRHTYGCTYSAGKGAVQRAIKRASGEAGTWGGKRQPAGGRPKAEQAEQEENQ